MDETPDPLETRRLLELLRKRPRSQENDVEDSTDRPNACEKDTFKTLWDYDEYEGKLVVEKFFGFLLGTGDFDSNPKQWKLFQNVDVVTEYSHTLEECMFFKYWHRAHNPAKLVEINETAILAEVKSIATKLHHCLAGSQPLAVRCMEKALAYFEKKGIGRQAWLEQTTPMMVGPNAIPVEGANGTKTYGELCRMCLYAMVLMEAVAERVKEDVQYNDELMDFYLHPPAPHFDNKYATRYGYLKNAGSSFTMVKSWSVVWLERMVDHALDEAHELTKAELSTISGGINDTLRMNISEAYLGDKFWTLLKDNALAASALLHEPEMPVSVSNTASGKKEIFMRMNKFYEALYFNWNLTFITIGSDSWLTMAKLFQPLVSCANPSLFIIVRAISLKIAVQTSRWAEFLGQPYTARLENVFTPEAREAMARVNKEAAEKYVGSCGNNDWESINRNFTMSNFIAVNKTLARLAANAHFLWKNKPSNGDNIQQSQQQTAGRRNILGYSAIIAAAALANRKKIRGAIQTLRPTKL